jgi:16S rRNA (guanine(966)-N(2))-methyltransferase RsmD
LLKIIAGQGRGRALATLPKTHAVRPILARIKKSVFDIIRANVPDSHFLDMYAGTGAVGLEAISRGAAFTGFLEKDLHCFDVIKTNLDRLGFADRGRVFRLDVLGDLSSLPKPFNVIFMGPPYVDLNKNALQLVVPTLANVQKYKLLAPSGIVIAQHHKKEIVSTLPEGWTLYREEAYGDTVVSFLRA